MIKLMTNRVAEWTNTSSPAAERMRRATAYRDTLWRTQPYRREDARIAELVSYCTALCGGDARAGGALAMEAIWS